VSFAVVRIWTLRGEPSSDLYILENGELEELRDRGGTEVVSEYEELEDAIADLLARVRGR